MAADNVDHQIVDDHYENAEKSGKDFRITSTRLMLTYKSHIDKNKLINFIDKKLKTQTIEEIYIAHENGDTSHGYKHTHVVFKCKPMLETTNCRFFDMETEEGDIIHPNIKLIKKIPGKVPNDPIAWIRAVRYLGKEDPENEYLKTYEQEEFDRQTRTMRGLIEKIITAPTKLDAYALAHKVSDIVGIDMIRKARPDQQQKRIDIETYPPQPWQISLLEEIKKVKKFNRTLKWYYDPIGNTGKTYFSKWSIDELGDQVFCMSAFGRNQDAAQIFMGLKEQGKLPRVLILDLSRNFKDRDSIYGTLENILDGNLTSTKYSGGVVNWTCEHVIVFANFLPHVTNMSKDRWDIRELVTEDSDEPVTVNNLSYYEVLKQLRDFHEDS